MAKRTIHHPKQPMSATVKTNMVVVEVGEKSYSFSLEQAIELRFKLSLALAEAADISKVIEDTARAIVDEQMILLGCCNAFHVTVDEIMSKARPERLTAPRHCAMWLYLNVLEKSNSDIAQRFNRTHGAVTHACESVENWISCKDRKGEIAQKLRNKLTT
jgi:chromosomal replication initiation ATPase DnaA